MSNLSKVFFHRLPPPSSIPIASTRVSAVLSVQDSTTRSRVPRYRSKGVELHTSSTTASSSSTCTLGTLISDLHTQTQTHTHSNPIMDSTLESQLSAANALFNELRLKPDVDPVALEDTKKRLGELKKIVAKAQAKEKVPKAGTAAAAVAGSSVSAAGAGGKDTEGKKKERLLLKTAKVQ